MNRRQLLKVWLAAPVVAALAAIKRVWAGADKPEDIHHADLTDADVEQGFGRFKGGYEPLSDLQEALVKEHAEAAAKVLNEIFSKP